MTEQIPLPVARLAEKVAAELHYPVTVTRVGSRRYELVAENDRVRATMQVKIRLNGHVDEFPGMLVVDGQSRPTQDVEVVRELLAGQRPTARAIEVEPTDETPPREVQDAVKQLTALSDGDSDVLATVWAGRHGAAWVVAMDASSPKVRSAHIRMIFHRHDGGPWHMCREAAQRDEQFALQAVIDGIDCSFTLARDMNSLHGLLTGDTPTPQAEKKPSTGVHSTSGARTRPNSVQVRNTTVIRN